MSFYQSCAIYDTLFFPVPSCPCNLSGISNNSMSLSFTWDAPLKPNGVITKYVFLRSCGGMEHVISITGSQTTTTLSGLLPYTNYSCSITAHTSVGGGPPATASVITLQDGEQIYHVLVSLAFCYIVPSGPPQSLVSSVTSGILTLFWSPPLFSQRNGVIISYLITCSSGGSIINSTRTSSTSLTITGLQPFTNYTCSVRAATIIGDGPAAVNTVETQEESKFLAFLTDNNNIFAL